VTKVKRPERIETEEEVLVNVLQCQPQPELNEAEMACRTLDVSEYGMKVTSCVPIPATSRLAISLDVDSGVYRLQGEVRWGHEEDRYYAGLRLDHDNSPDFDAWARRFQRHA